MRFCSADRLLLCVLQGFSSGLPLYVLIQLVPGWLRSEGVDLSTIGLLSLATLAIHVEVRCGRRCSTASGRPSSAAGGVGRSSAKCCCSRPSPYSASTAPTSGSAIVMLMFATAICGATQDIVLDAYRRELLADNELGAGNSFFVQAYRLSSLVPGSLALILSDRLPWSRRVFIVAAFMLIGIVTMLCAPETSDDRLAPRSIRGGNHGAVSRVFHAQRRRVRAAGARVPVLLQARRQHGGRAADAVLPRRRVLAHADRHDREVLDSRLDDRREHDRRR